MNLFFFDSLDVQTGVFTLPADESKHIVRVLRFRNGTQLHATDGKGMLYTCEIINDNPQNCELKIVDSKIVEKPFPYRLHIACALTKNIARMEFFLEKAVEIGIDEFSPIEFKRSERSVYKVQRMNKIAISALKQSQQMFLPVLNGVNSISAFLDEMQTSDIQKFIAYQNNETPHLKDMVKPNKDVVVLIGPEGDFTDEEISKALDTGFKMASLGSSRLRTETAALLSCTAVNLINS